MIKSSEGAALSPVSPSRSGAGGESAVAVLVLHGGSADSFAPTQWRNLAVVRLWPVARVIARKREKSAVYRLRFAIKGWNGDGSSALRDTRWALAQLRERHPGVPITVVGHSLGGRVAAHVGGDPGVAGIVMLAGWTPSNDPAAQLAGVPVVTIQGGRDRVIPEPTTRPWMARATHAGAHVQRTLLPWAGHTMLRRFWVWHRLSAEGVATILGSAAFDSAARSDSDSAARSDSAASRHAQGSEF
ncbi:putative esterase [Nakamurella sp. UYEF19]|uniref:alpha/beta fold hydrolase n=1 Tax=Nakamurella sp. UYEF19 TaxID=1756392 RepID=UPI003397CC3E